MDTNVRYVGEGRRFSFVGDFYTTLASGEDTGGAHALIRAEIPPGSGHPPHLHRREDEAFYVLEGSLTFLVDGRTISAAPGTWITLPRGSLHTFRNTGPTTATILILVSPPGLEGIFTEVGVVTMDRKISPPVTPAAVERLMAVAPKYGIEIRPTS